MNVFLTFDNLDSQLNLKFKLKHYYFRSMTIDIHSGLVIFHICGKTIICKYPSPLNFPKYENEVKQYFEDKDKIESIVNKDNIESIN